MDWTSSGIANSYEYELLDSSMSHTGWLDNVTGGSIVQSYRGDYRVTASLDLDGQVPPMNGYVRIWHSASKDGEVVRKCLATLVPEPPGMEYRLGRWTGSLDLYSAMKKMDTNLRRSDRALAKNTVAADFFEALVEACNARPYVSSGISRTAKTSKAHVFEFGTSLLSNAHVIADSVNGYIIVTDAGYVALSPYVLPSRRSASWSLESGIESVMLIGVSREEPEITNRVIARYEADGKTYFSTADLASSHPWSWNRIGRREAVSMDADAVSTPIQANLDKLAARELESLSGTGARYEVRALYSPDVKPGTVGTVAYADSPSDTGLRFKAFCSQREIQLDAAMATTLTLEEIA